MGKPSTYLSKKLPDKKTFPLKMVKGVLNRPEGRLISLLPHGHSEKPIALRADILTPYFYLQDGQKNL
jgi:hypothetical protein